MCDIHVLVGLIFAECFETVASLYIPDFDSSIMTTSSNMLAISAESNRADTISMTAHNLEAFSTFNIPQPYHPIITRTGNKVFGSIGAKSHGPDTIRMSS